MCSASRSVTVVMQNANSDAPATAPLVVHEGHDNWVKANRFTRRTASSFSHKPPAAGGAKLSSTRPLLITRRLQSLCSFGLFLKINPCLNIPRPAELCFVLKRLWLHTKSVSRVDERNQPRLLGCVSPRFRCEGRFQCEGQMTFHVLSLAMFSDTELGRWQHK